VAPARRWFSIGCAGPRPGIRQCSDEHCWLRNIYRDSGRKSLAGMVQISGALTLALALTADVDAIGAQQVPTGARIRYQAWTLNGGTPRIKRGRGVVVARLGDTLVVHRAAADTVRVAMRAMQWLDVRQGRSRSRGALQGLAIGIATGAVIGAVIGAARQSYDDFAWMALPALSLSGGSVGTLVGAAVGAPRWQRVVPPPETPRR
jgi:hypothetical protein